MKKGGGHSKGASFERQVCKELSLWLSKGKRDDLLWRTSQSGGRATMRARKGITTKSQLGDIGAIDPEGKRLTDRCLIECKHVRDLQLDGWVLRRRPAGRLYKFWRKLEQDAQANGRTPVMIAKQNQRDAIVITNAKGASYFKDFELGYARIHHARLDFDGHMLYVVFYDAMLNMPCPF